MKKTGFLALLLLGLCLVFAGVAASQDPSAEWRKSKHGNRQLAVDEATWEGRKEVTAHCGRCHSEQGFKAWLPQLLRGDAGLFKKPDGTQADEAYIKGLGLTKDQVQPITCEVCHSTGSALRIQDNIPMLPNGLAIRAVGKGALCMACHNTRKGRMVWDSPDPKGYFQPHEAAQTDVILGKNVFFYNDTGDTASPHAVFTGDSCVTCHKMMGTGGHTLKPGECGPCRGEETRERTDFAEVRPSGRHGGLQPDREH